jgi:hypothetical protein
MSYIRLNKFISYIYVQKTKDFNPQEKKERKRERERKKERKKERMKEIADYKNPEQTAR